MMAVVADRTVVGAVVVAASEGVATEGVAAAGEAISEALSHVCCLLTLGGSR
jgi:hypothetical protein